MQTHFCTVRGSANRTNTRIPPSLVVFYARIRRAAAVRAISVAEARMCIQILAQGVAFPWNVLAPDSLCWNDLG